MYSLNVFILKFSIFSKINVNNLKYFVLFFFSYPFGLIINFYQLFSRIMANNYGNAGYNGPTNGPYGNAGYNGANGPYGNNSVHQGQPHTDQNGVPILHYGNGGYNGPQAQYGNAGQNQPSGPFGGAGYTGPTAGTGFGNAGYTPSPPAGVPGNGFVPGGVDVHDDHHHDGHHKKHGRKEHDHHHGHHHGHHHKH